MSVSPNRCRSGEAESIGKHEQALSGPHVRHRLEVIPRKGRGVPCLVDDDDLEVIARDRCDHCRQGPTCGRANAQCQRVSEIVLSVDIAPGERQVR